MADERVTAPEPATEPGASADADLPGARDRDEVARLRQGDHDAFERLVERHGPQMLRVAALYAPGPLAEEVVQDTWIGVLQGIHRFEGRSSLRTWIFRILVNIARTKGSREHRQVPFSAFADLTEDAGPAVDPSRFQGPDGPKPGHWISLPTPWDEFPEERLEANETFATVRAAVDALPPSQREVITLRDIEGWSSEEVCNALSISATNQRVLLHRARSKVRRAIEDELARSA